MDGNLTGPGLTVLTHPAFSEAEAKRERSQVNEAKPIDRLRLHYSMPSAD